MHAATKDKVTWQPPMLVWVEINTDEAANKGEESSATGGVLRDAQGC